MGNGLTHKVPPESCPAPQSAGASDLVSRSTDTFLGLPVGNLQTQNSLRCEAGSNPPPSLEPIPDRPLADYYNLFLALSPSDMHDLENAARRREYLRRGMPYSGPSGFGIAQGPLLSFLPPEAGFVSREEMIAHFMPLLVAAAHQKSNPAALVREIARNEAARNYAERLPHSTVSVELVDPDGLVRNAPSAMRFVVGVTPVEDQNGLIPLTSFDRLSPRTLEMELMVCTHNAEQLAHKLWLVRKNWFPPGLDIPQMRDRGVRPTRLQNPQPQVVRGLNLEGTRANPVILDHADLDGCNFENLTIRHVRFCHATLRGAKFAGAKLEDCTFERAGLTEAEFQGESGTAEIRNCEFTSADLSGVNFSGMTLHDCRLDNANLPGTQFAGASLRRCSFKDFAPALTQPARPRTPPVS
jgi:hypothetical protein